MSATPDAEKRERFGHALPRFFEPQPLGLLEYLAARIDREDWESYANWYSTSAACHERTASDLRAILSAHLSAFPELSVDSYDAMWAMARSFEYGFVPARTDRRVLEAFALTLAIQAEIRGIIVADAADGQLVRLVTLADQLGIECLRLCGEFVSWIRMHIQGHGWAVFSMLASAVILELSAARLLSAAAEHLGTQELKASPDQVAWFQLLGQARNAIAAKLSPIVPSTGLKVEGSEGS